MCKKRLLGVFVDVVCVVVVVAVVGV